MGVRQTSGAALAVLAAAVFVVALGYGAILPALPLLLGSWLGPASTGKVAWYTGLVSGLYMFALFAFSPLWGALSDRIGRRPVILIGLAGYVATLVLFHTFHSLPALYANRLLAGAFASAVLPVTAAFITDASTKERRLRWFALTSAATLAGFLLGPAMSGAMSTAAELRAAAVFSLSNPAGLPVAAAAGFGTLVWAAAFFILPRSGPSGAVAPPRDPQSGDPPHRSVFVLLGLTLLVMLGVGAFEVGVALEGQQTMRLAPAEVSLLFMICTAIMGIVQAVLFAKPSLHDVLTRDLALASGFGVLALGFVWLSMAADFHALIPAVVLIAGAAGTLLAALSQLVSIRSDSAAGAMLGLQTSAASLGQGIGSVAGGWLFGSLMMSSFWITAALMAAAAVAAAGASFASRAATVRAER